MKPPPDPHFRHRHPAELISRHVRFQLAGTPEFTQISLSG
jgi:hypothetical protein